MRTLGTAPKRTLLRRCRRIFQVACNINCICSKMQTLSCDDMAEIVKWFGDEETFLHLQCMFCIWYQLKCGLDVTQMFFEFLGKYNDIVYINQSMVQLIWDQNNVRRLLERCQGMLNSKRHANIPIKTVLCDKRNLEHVVFVKLNLPIATVRIQYRK